MTQLGKSLAPFSGHLEELNRVSVECRMVKHCRVDKTFQPTQCGVMLAVEMLSLRSVVRKSLEVLQGERKHGQGRRKAMTRELQDWRP